MEINSTKHNKTAEEVGLLVMKLFESDLVDITKESYIDIDTKLNESIQSTINDTNKVKTIITNIELAIERSSSTRRSGIAKILGGK